MAKRFEPEEVALHSEALAAIVRDMAERERELRQLEEEVERRRAEAAETGAAIDAQLMRLDERREAVGLGQGERVVALVNLGYPRAEPPPRERAEPGTYVSYLD